MNTLIDQRKLIAHQLGAADLSGVSLTTRIAIERACDFLNEAAKQQSERGGLEQQHHRDSAELRRLCHQRDQQRDGRLAALERAAKVEASAAGLVEALRHVLAAPTLERAQIEANSALGHHWAASQ